MKEKERKTPLTFPSESFLEQLVFLFHCLLLCKRCRTCLLQFFQFSETVPCCFPFLLKENYLVILLIQAPTNTLLKTTTADNQHQLHTCHTQSFFPCSISAFPATSTIRHFYWRCSNLPRCQTTLHAFMPSRDHGCLFLLVELVTWLRHPMKTWNDICLRSNLISGALDLNFFKTKITFIQQHYCTKK